MKIRTIISVLALLVGAVHAGTFRIEGEDLTASQGKIQIGNHAYDYSGGKMILATARSTVLTGSYKLDKAGKYQVWVRTLTQGGKWRNGELSINGQALGIFGDEPLKEGEKTHWHWIRLKDAELPAGKIGLSVFSKMGYVRIDAIILTDEENFTPPEKTADIFKIPALPSDDPAAGLEKLPKPIGKGEKMLLFHGSRPWVGKFTAQMLAKCGGSVTLLDSTYLDGMGGASIKTFLTDLVEPKARDGITPAMLRLAEYKLVIITAIPAEMQEKMFTPERIEKLKKYVKNGGTLLVTYCVPAAFGDLLPVQPGKMVSEITGLTAQKPDGKNFRSVPEQWPLFGGFREVKLDPDAKVLLPVTDKDGKAAGILAAVKTYGKGKVLYLNENWDRKAGLRQFMTWAYGKALFAALAAEVSGIELDPAKAIYSMPDPPARKQHGSLAITLRQPVMSIADSKEKVSVRDHTIRFGNGIRMTVSKDGTLNVFWGDASEPYVTGLAAPKLVFSGKLADIDASTAELAAGRSEGKTVSGDWKLEKIEPSGETVKLTYSTADGTVLEWEFKAGVLQLEDRTFNAFAERAEIVKSPKMIESLRVTSLLALGKDTADHMVRRMSCYSPPRGYVEFDFSGKQKADTWSWGFFGSGQPFTWVCAPSGVYSEFVEEPVPASPRLVIEAGEKRILQSMNLRAGYRSAPVRMPYVWHAFSPGKEKDNNEWMAMYQFQRKNLRGKAGLQSIAPVPTATWQNVCSREQIDAAVRTAARLGFKRMALPLCPSPIEGIDNPKLMARFKMIRENGLIPFPWTAGDYCHGDSEMIFREHKDWFLRDMKGKIHAYANIHPVIDLNNAEFRKWYFAKMDNAVKGGVGALYFDMYGTAMGNINYGRRNSLPCLYGGIEIFRHFYAQNVMIGIEGQNPLVIDNWWYRQRVYRPFQGREFSIFLSSPSTGTAGDDMALDYFRTSMFGTFTYINVDGYAFGFERTPGELAKVERMAKLNPHINKAQQLVGYPYIRETPFGTSWISEKGGALFFYDGVKELKVDLPDGWSIEGMKGNVLRDVKPDTVVYLKAPGK